MPAEEKSSDNSGRRRETSQPPTLTRRRLAMHLRRRNPRFPAELVQAAAREIIAALSGALAGGRSVILRGFGRFQVRRYRNSSKRLGLIFRPSPGLTARLNRDPEP